MALGETIRRFGRKMAQTAKGLVPAYRAHYQAASTPTAKSFSPQAQKYKKAMAGATKKGGSNGIGVGP